MGVASREPRALRKLRKLLPLAAMYLCSLHAAEEPGEERCWTALASRAAWDAESPPQGTYPTMSQEEMENLQRAR